MCLTIHPARRASRRAGSLLKSFQVRTAEAFHRLRAEIDEDVLEALDRLEPDEDGIDLDKAGIKGPSSTWTYAVNDDPFRHQLGRMLTGPGQTTLAIGAAVLAAPFLILSAIVNRFFRRRGRLS